MSATTVENPPVCALPPIICGNIREKIEAEEVSLDELLESRRIRTKRTTPLTSMTNPMPLHPLTITWSPDPMCFELKEEAVAQRLWIWNTCSRIIYIHCCHMWDEAAFLGASWDFYPRTRFQAAPGLISEVIVCAKPKKVSPVPCAYAKLQVAAAHKMDTVIGYFAVPINVKFYNFFDRSGEGG